MKTPKPKKTKKTKKSADTVAAMLIVLGRKYTAEGATVAEAIAALNPGPVKGRSILVVNGRERILQPATTYRLFNSHGLTRDVALKNAVLLFT